MNEVANVGRALQKLNVVNIILPILNFKKKYLTAALSFAALPIFALSAQEKPVFQIETVYELDRVELTKTDHPQGLSVSIMGDIYIADTGHNRILKLDPKGKYINHVGGFGWKNNQFDAPVDVFASDGLNIYVADLNNQRIQRYSKKLEFVSSFGGSKLTELTAEKSGVSTEPIGNPNSVAVSSQGDLFYSDRESGRIIKLDRFGKREIAFGGFAEGRGKLKNPGKISVTSRFVYVADGDRIVVFDYYGNYIREIGSGKLKTPADVAVDAKGRLYVADHDQVFVFDADGQAIASILSYTFEKPAAVDCALGKLYVLDAGNVIVFQILEGGE